MGTIPKRSRSLNAPLPGSYDIMEVFIGGGGVVAIPPITANSRSHLIVYLFL